MAVAISLKNKISTEKTGTSQQDNCGFNFLQAVYASRQLALRFTKIALALSAEYNEYLQQGPTLPCNDTNGSPFTNSLC